MVSVKQMSEYRQYPKSKIGAVSQHVSVYSALAPFFRQKSGIGNKIKLKKFWILHLRQQFFLETWSHTRRNFLCHLLPLNRRHRDRSIVLCFLCSDGPHPAAGKNVPPIWLLPFSGDFQPEALIFQLPFWVWKRFSRKYGPIEKVRKSPEWVPNAKRKWWMKGGHFAAVTSNGDAMNLVITGELRFKVIQTSFPTLRW